MDQVSDVLIIIFFSSFLAKFFAKILSIYFLIFFYKITKIKSFEYPKSVKSIKNNTWNIRLLVDDSFVPSSKQPSVLYCRLTDFNSVLFVKDVEKCWAF